MPKYHLILRRLVSIVTLALLILLCWQCISIQLAGSHPDNIKNGVQILQTYRSDDISRRLTQIRPVAVLWGLLVCAAWAVRPKADADPKQAFPAKMVPQTAPLAGKARVLLVIVSMGLILWGTGNGGMRDVFVKAINICTECIGLG